MNISSLNARSFSFTTTLYLRFPCENILLYLLIPCNFALFCVCCSVRVTDLTLSPVLDMFSFLYVCGLCVLSPDVIVRAIDECSSSQSIWKNLAG